MIPRRVDLRLYGILDRAVLANSDLTQLAEHAVAGGVTLLQYRDKSGDTRAMIDTARQIRKALKGRVPLLINDRVDVALASGAEGVHLGRDDMAPSDARALLGPSAVIGVTLKAEHDLATLDAACVDYGCIGGVFATASKDNPEPPIGLGGFAALRDKARASRLPVGAIAGIDEANAATCIGAGADGIALISALFLASDIEAKARRLRTIVDAALAARGAI